MVGLLAAMAQDRVDTTREGLVDAYSSPFNRPETQVRKRGERGGRRASCLGLALS